MARNASSLEKRSVDANGNSSIKYSEEIPSLGVLQISETSDEVLMDEHSRNENNSVSQNSSFTHNVVISPNRNSCSPILSNANLSNAQDLKVTTTKSKDSLNDEINGNLTCANNITPSVTNHDDKTMGLNIQDLTLDSDDVMENKQLTFETHLSPNHDLKVEIDQLSENVSQETDEQNTQLISCSKELVDPPEQDETRLDDELIVNSEVEASVPKEDEEDTTSKIVLFIRLKIVWLTSSCIRNLDL